MGSSGAERALPPAFLPTLMGFLLNFTHQARIILPVRNRNAWTGIPVMADNAANLRSMPMVKKTEKRPKVD
jgi:hypothetical protein